MTKRTKRILAMMSSKPKLRKISGLPPLTYTAKEEGTLKNYRIYGQTVDGESVGDRTGNLFDGEIESGSWNIDKQPCLKIVTNTRMRNANFIKVDGNSTYSITLSSEKNVSLLIHFLDAQCNYISETTWQNNILNFNTPSQCEYINIIFKKENNEVMALSDISNIMLNAGSTPLPYEPYGYKVPVTVEGKNLCNNIWEQKLIDSNTGIASSSSTAVCCDFIPVKPNVTYSCSRTIRNNYNNLRCYEANKNYLGTGVDLANKANPLGQWESFGTFMITDARVSYIRFNDMSNSLDTKYMLVEGTYTAETMPPYEPVTTNLYLPEQIRKVGDEAEYIDFMEQKQHFADGTSVDVTLPALPTLPGTNVLSVETEVQPSSVEIEGRIKPVVTGGG